MKTLLEYATEAEADAYATKVKEFRAAETEVTRIRTALTDTETQKLIAQTNEQRYIRASAQRAVGSDIVPEPPKGPTSAQLDAQSTELSRLLREAEMLLGVRKGQLRSAASELLRVCAERCAEDYVKAAKTLGWCWTQIAAVDLPLGQQVGLGHWMRLMVPGASCFPAMAQQGYEMPVLMAGDRLTAQVAAAPIKIKAEAAARFGEWPL